MHLNANFRLGQILHVIWSVYRSIFATIFMCTGAYSYTFYEHPVRIGRKDNRSFKRVMMKRKVLLHTSRLTSKGCICAYLDLNVIC